MKFRHTVIIAVVFIAVIAVIGIFSGSQNCSTIGSCRNCWSSSNIQVTSDLCPTSEPCNARPYLQQHNAVVDTLLCACANAKSVEYEDTNLNKQIEDAHFAMRGGCTDEVLSVPQETRENNGVFCATDVQRLSVQLLCDSPGQYLAKRPYG